MSLISSNDLEDQRHLGSTFAFLIPICTAILFSSSNVAGKTSATKNNPLPPELKEIINSAARKDTDFPGDQKFKVSVFNPGPIKENLPQSIELVIPIKITFTKLSNSYCVLALISKQSQTQFLSTEPLVDNCNSWKLLNSSDLNDDGIVDFVFEETLPSNRYDTLATEPRVFVSDQKMQSYCYSEQGGNLISDSAALDASVYEKLRASKLSCSSH